MNRDLPRNVVKFLAILTAVVIGYFTLILTVRPANAMEWPKEIAINSIACIEEDDAASILLTHKRKDFASAQARYGELKTQSLCLSGSYWGTFVRVAHEVTGLVFDGEKVTGFVVEMEAAGHQFYLLVMRKPDPEA